LDLPSFIWLWRVAAWSMGLSMLAYLCLATTGIWLLYSRKSMQARPGWLRPLHYSIGGCMVAMVVLLLAIGLAFFIRTSTKVRIDRVRLVSEQPEPSLLEQLQQYFTQRAFRIVTVNADKNLVVYQGRIDLLASALCGPSGRENPAQG